MIRALKPVVSLTAMAVLLAACKKSEPPSSGTAPSTTPSASAAPATAPTPATPAGPPAVEALTKHPELLTSMFNDWRKRVDGFLTGNNDNACPAAQVATGKDEFEKHDAKEAALKQCSVQNSKAVELLKRCPVLLSAPVKVAAYDFEKSTLSLKLQRPNNMLTSANSRIWWDRAFLLSWPGLLPQRLKPGNNLPRDVRCQGGWIDNLAGMSNTNIDLALTPDAAKSFKERLGPESPYIEPAYAEIAVLLDGGAAEEPLDCDASVPKTATGRVLAWRVMRTGRDRLELVPWTNVGSWEPPADCAELKKLLAPKE